MTRAVPGSRADYGLFSSHATRWRDNDMYGHMNNVVHYELFDAGVNAWLIGAGVLDPLRGAQVGLVVESGCRYHAELRFPGAVDLGLRVGHLGRSSVRYELGLFAPGADRAAAEGFLTHVFVDAETRRPAEIAAPLRALLEGARAG